MDKHHSEFYDWVNRQVDLPLISYTGDQLADLDFKCWNKNTTNDICDFLESEGIEEYTISCYLSNKGGHPVSKHKALTCGALLCREMEQAWGRREVSVKLPNGKTANLEIVKILVKGYVGVNILDASGAVICRTSKGIPFATVQTFYLCAPNGTDVECAVTFFECDAVLLCKNSIQTDFQQLDLSISLCLDVRVVSHSCYCSCKKCYNHHHHHKCDCHPREELEAVTVCPVDKFPPQCPQIFPGHN